MKYILAALVLFLAGCLTSPTTAEMQAADYGPYPADYQAIVRNYMDDYLNDSESARYKFINQPARFTTNDLTKHIYGWTVCVDTIADEVVQNNCGQFE